MSVVGSKDLEENGSPDGVPSPRSPRSPRSQASPSTGKDSLEIGQKPPTKGAQKPRHRPPRLELVPPSTAEVGGSQNGGSLSASSGSAGSLKTPKELATDIAIQCVSPGIAPFASMSDQAKDAVIRSRSIEAQQRKIIARRMRQGSAGSVREILVDGDSLPEDPELEATPVDPTTPFDSPTDLRGSGHLKPTTRRRAPPAMLNLHTSRYGNQPSLAINSAPLGRSMVRPPSIDAPLGSAVGHGPARYYSYGGQYRSSSGHEIRYIPSGFDRARPATATAPRYDHETLRPAAVRPTARSEGFREHSRNRTVSAGSSISNADKPSVAPSQEVGNANNNNDDEDDDDDDDDEENGRDPEEAALSDDEVDVELRAIDDEDEIQAHKRRRLDNAQRPLSISFDELHPSPGLSAHSDSNSPPLRRPAANHYSGTGQFVYPGPGTARSLLGAAKQTRKQRFLEVCAEMYDLMNANA